MPLPFREAAFFLRGQPIKRRFAVRSMPRLIEQRNTLPPLCRMKNDCGFMQRVVSLFCLMGAYVMIFLIKRQAWNMLGLKAH